MHEVSIARALLDTVDEVARAEGLQHITRLQVVLGDNAGVTPDALCFALDLAREGTVAQGAEVLFTGPGVEVAAPHKGDEHDRHPSHAGHAHAHGHDHDHDHSHDDDFSAAENLERWTVRLDWIEGT